MLRQVLFVAGLFMFLGLGVPASADVWEIGIPGEAGVYPFEFPSATAAIDSVSISLSGTWVPVIYCCERDPDGYCTLSWSAGILVEVFVAGQTLMFEYGERFETTTPVIDNTNICVQDCQWFPDGAGELEIRFDYSAVDFAQSGCGYGTIQDASVVLDTPVLITFYYGQIVAAGKSSWGRLKGTYR